MGAETWVAIGNFIKAIFVGAGAGASAGYVFAVNVARMAVLALAAKAFTPKPDLSQLAREKTQTVRDTIHPQRFVYGRDLISGPIIYGNTRGTDNAFMTLAVALTGHEIDAIEEFHMDSHVIDASTGIAGGNVIAGQYTDVMQINWLLGVQSQSCAALLQQYSALFGALTHRGLGHAYMVVEMELVEGNQAYENGAPANLKALVRGKKVYDPRLDSTNGGTGLHRLNDPATWEWSDNPALCLADFLRDEKFGMKEDDDRIDWPMVITAANICDELVSIPGAATQKRYTCNVTFQSTEKRGDVRDTLLNSMLGRMVFSQGVWKMWAGAALTPDVTLDETYLAGSIQVQATAGAKERYNRVRGKFVDASRNYTASSYPELRSTVYETADGGEVRPLVVDFLATNNTFEAQRKGITTLKQSRQQRVVVFAGNLKCFSIQPGAVVSLNLTEFGFAGETFFVTEWKMGEQGVSLTMIEEDSTSWNDPTVGEYAVRSATGAISFGSVAISPPSGVTVAPATGGVVINWTAPHSTATEIWASDDNVRGNAILIATVMGETYLDQVANGRTRFYWLRSVATSGVRSVFEPNLTTTTYQSASILDATGSYVPDFTPGFIGGADNFVYTLNADISVPNDGEIKVVGDTFNHPDGSVITKSPVTSQINTVYEGAVTGRFYVMYSATNAETRFGGVANDWGTYTKLVCVTWDSVNGWRARNNAGTYFAFTPLVTDCIIAAFDKIATSGGINSMVKFTGGIQGDQGNPGNDGGDGLNNATVTLYHKNTSSVTPPTLFTGTFTYTFATGVLSGGTLNGWSQDAPSLAQGEYLWASQATASATTATDSVPAGDFNTPQVVGIGGTDGTPGGDGLNVATVTLYHKNTSGVTPPASFSGTFTYTFATGVLSGGTLNGWSQTAPSLSAGEYLWSRQAYASASTATDSVPTADFGTAQVVGIGGTDGGDGLNNATVTLYNKNTSGVTPPTAFTGTFTYTFATGVLSGGTLNGWSQDAPTLAQGEYLWARQATASATTATDSVPTADFNTAQVVGIGGTDGTPGGDGTDGLNVATVTLFNKNTSAVTPPTSFSGTFTYTFSTGVLSGGTLNGWSQDAPSLAKGEYLWARQAYASATTATDSVPTGDFNTAQVVGVGGVDGADGGDGKSVFKAVIYRRSASAPATPTADDGQYNFTTGVLTPATNWSVEPPAANGQSLYQSTGTFEITGTTGIDTTVTWTAPTLVLPDSQYRDIKFQRNNATPSTPTGDSPAGWLDGIPSGTAPVWQITGVKNSAGNLVGSWSAPERIEGMAFRGAYSSGVAYIRHDIVLYQERTYILVVDNSTGNAPSGTNAGNAFWDLIAGKGDPGDPPSTFTDTITITGTAPVNLRSLANTAGYDGISNATVTFNLNSGTTITGSSNGGNAIDTGSWPATPTISLTLNIAGTARGGGGRGGNGGTNGGSGSNGNDGGDAIYCQENITINNNTGGLIQAGGGGGGGGGSRKNGSPEFSWWGGGGGGGGFPNGSGGSGGAGEIPIQDGNNGNPGTTGGGGTGGAGGSTSGDGGDGGNVNTNGSIGGSATGGATNGGGGSGGTRGNAIRQNGNTVTYNANGGTIQGNNN